MSVHAPNDQFDVNAGWRGSLLLNDAREPRPNFANVRTAMRKAPELRHIHKYDESRGVLMLVARPPWEAGDVPWSERPWTDNDTALLTDWLQRQGMHSVTLQTVTQVIKTFSAARASADACPTGISAAELKAKVFKPVAWVLNDFLPEGMSMLAGKPKLGKSWLMLLIAIAVARGGWALDKKCIEGDVLYAALEDNERRLKGRMQKLVGDGEWPERLTFWTDMKRLEEGGIEQLRNWIAGSENPRLIVIDVFSKVRRTKGAQEGLYDADYQAVVPLKRLADEMGVAIVIVHHLRKMGADVDPLDAVSGSTGLTGAMDTILVLNRGSGGVTLYGRGRDIEEIESAVQFDRSTCRWSLLGDAHEVRLSDERRKILDALRAATEPMGPRELADVTGMPSGNIRRLLISMIADGEVEKLARGKYTIPNSTP
jgi:hypothetical protein